jgi:uncharacterized protein YifN (PemK superfamily)
LNVTFDPKPGDVIRYDFLWDREQSKGQIDGTKDRPCAVVLILPPTKDGSKRVMLLPVSHSPPTAEQSAIEISAKVSKHLGLDEERSWIFTHEVNTLTWEADRFPAGVVPVKDGVWKYGQLPASLSEKLIASVLEQHRARSLKQINRD